jgi:hypothetical protein
MTKRRQTEGTWWATLVIATLALCFVLAGCAEPRPAQKAPKRTPLVQADGVTVTRR